MKLTRRAQTWMIVAVIVIVCSLVGAGVVSAQTQNQAGGTGGLRIDILENMYQEAGLYTQLLQLRIDLANKIAARAQELIDKAKSNGKDTTALESALANFKTAIGQAQAAHDKAVGILNAHDGFDGAGKMTDPDKAEATLKAVRDALRDGQEALRSGTRDFREAVRQWRLANKAQKQSTPQP